MATPETLLRDLLGYLGIDYVLTVHSKRDGTLQREHHLYAEPERIQDVLRWQLRWNQRDVVRVFEGDPPPF